MRKVLFLFGTIVFAQQMPNPPGMQCHERTLVLFAEGSAVGNRKDLTSAHLDYIRRQMREGKIIAGGPFVDNQGAAMVFGSSNWAEVEGILKDEPYTKAGVIRVAEHKEWTACELLGARIVPAAP
jgi:uncharacterized protein